MSRHCRWGEEKESQTDLKLRALVIMCSQTFLLPSLAQPGFRVAAAEASFPAGCVQEDSGNQSVKVSSAMGDMA